MSMSGGRYLQILLHCFLSAVFSVVAVNCSLYNLPADPSGFLWGKDDHDPYIEE